MQLNHSTEYSVWHKDAIAILTPSQKFPERWTVSRFVLDGGFLEEFNRDLPIEPLRNVLSHWGFSLEEPWHSRKIPDNCEEIVTGLEGPQVYFIEAVGLNRVKIGRTTGHAEYRLKEIQRMSPVPLRLITQIPANKFTEGRLHRRFSHLRLHGEWFEFGDDLQNYLVSIKRGLSE